MTRLAPACAFACCVAVAAPSWAAVATITNDTYVDSFSTPDAGDNSRTNYGRSQVVKAVTSAASNSFPAPSVTHVLLTLPDAVFADLGTGGVASAVLTFTAKTNQLAGRQLELHPLTHGFVAGTGGVATSSMGGTANTDANPVGADYQSYDGLSTHRWATPGGDFDADHFVTTTGTGGTVIGFDLTRLLNDPVTRAEIRSYGLLVRTVNEGDYPNPQQFVSLYSGDSTIANTKPTLTYAVPEPAALGLTAAATLGLARRRRA